MPPQIPKRFKRMPPEVEDKLVAMQKSAKKEIEIQIG